MLSFLPSFFLLSFYPYFPILLPLLPFPLPFLPFLSSGPPSPKPWSGAIAGALALSCVCVVSHKAADVLTNFCLSHRNSCSG